MNRKKRLEHLITRRKQDLEFEIGLEIPEVKNTCDKAEKDGVTILMHQDAFAANYQQSEYVLLGKVIKYIGTRGLNVMIIGTNRETIDGSTVNLSL